MIYHRWAAQIGAFYQRLFALVHRMLDGKPAARTTIVGRDAAFVGSGMSWEPVTLGIGCAPPGSLLAAGNGTAGLLGHGMLGNFAWQNAYAQQALDAQRNQMMQGMTNAAYGMMNQQ